jgi:hypothetical protein
MVQQVSRTPKIHSGPFNAQCIFMENAKLIFDKITNYLNRLNIKHY